ncbi:SulP family inorganic anion transporter [Luteococcus sp. OSA5]|uniref:SulP family inorganic anion transporter n=1 Tax=Luteococcus sp. OSA5 TaxID=3401630 RepID=UPI003B427C64
MSLTTHFASLLPNRDDVTEVRQHWKGDILAGITTGIVALPLALAFGVASGIGATAGLITAIVAGIAAAIFGGSRFQVSGPTGAMVVILAPLVAQHGLAVIPLLSILAGLILVAGALAGVGRAVSLIPWPVIEGFTAGIGLILILQQIPNALGVEAEVGANTLAAGIDAIVQADYPSALIPLGVALGTALLIVVFDKISPQFPGTLAAIVIATLGVMAAKFQIANIGEIPDSLPAPTLPAFSTDLLMALVPGAISIALLAGIESLLSARVAAGMVRGGTYHPDRELFGQGIANAASGMFGGMPATGAIVRTAVNIRAGGRSRLSPIVHALLLMLIVYAASDVVSVIPMAALAGVLFVTAGRMIPWEAMSQILRSTRADALIFILAAIVTVVFDLIWAILLGVVIAVIVMMRHFARLSGIHREGPVEDPRIRILRIDGAMFFGVADRISHEITRLDAVRVVILRLSRVGIMDATGAKVLSEIVTALRQADNHVLLVGLREQHEALTNVLGLPQAMDAPDRFFDSMDEALVAAEQIVAEDERELEEELRRQALAEASGAPDATVSTSASGKFGSQLAARVNRMRGRG